MNNFFAAFRRRSQQRRTLSHLSQLDDHLLADIGFTRDDLGRVMPNGATGSRIRTRNT